MDSETPNYGFLLRATDLRTKLREILNGTNLLFRLLTWDQFNLKLNMGNP
jgi:hypothetical protein